MPALRRTGALEGAERAAAVELLIREPEQAPLSVLEPDVERRMLRGALALGHGARHPVEPRHAGPRPDPHPRAPAQIARSRGAQAQRWASHWHPGRPLPPRTPRRRPQPPGSTRVFRGPPRAPARGRPSIKPRSPFQRRSPPALPARSLLRRATPISHCGAAHADGFSLHPSAHFHRQCPPIVPRDTPIHFASASLRVGFVPIPNTTTRVGTSSRHPEQQAARWRPAATGSWP